jgi:hypothetical protein
MREDPLRSVEAIVANGSSLWSTEDFIEDRTDLSEVVRSAPWLSAWIETSRENRRQRVAELMEGKRQFAGGLGTSRHVDHSSADGDAGVGVKT